jgi:hypothetical protein
LWIKDGKLFLAMHIGMTPDGDYTWPSEWYAAVYVLEKIIGNETMGYGRAFQWCYDTAYKEVDSSYLGEGFPLSGFIFWDNWLFMEDTVAPISKCLWLPVKFTSFLPG